MTRPLVTREGSRTVVYVDGEPVGDPDSAWVDADDLRERWPKLSPVLDRMFDEHAVGIDYTREPPHVAVA